MSLKPFKKVIVVEAVIYDFIGIILTDQNCLNNVDLHQNAMVKMIYNKEWNLLILTISWIP